jgi:hypothetical protein
MQIDKFLTKAGRRPTVTESLQQAIVIQQRNVGIAKGLNMHRADIHLTILILKDALRQIERTG